MRTLLEERPTKAIAKCEPLPSTGLNKTDVKSVAEMNLHDFINLTHT